MKVGDKVVIIRSPFLSIKAGTIATIQDIKFVDFGRKWTLYILDTVPCHSFREWEIKELENDKKE